MRNVGYFLFPALRELFQQPHQERERQAQIELIENLMQPEQDRRFKFSLFMQSL